MKRVIRVLLLGILGLLIVSILSEIFPDPGWFKPQGIPVSLPMPYRIPAHRGMADLRIAMVHDVVLERYVRHGAARDRAIRQASELSIVHDPYDFDSYDDAALAAERLGDNASARRLLEDKARRQGLVIPRERTGSVSMLLDDKRELPTIDEPAHQRYRTYSNLGTILIHGALPIMMSHDEASSLQRVALADARSGLACLYEAVRLDPSAHFGRELWQIVIVEHVMRAAEDPALLRRFDAIGDPLDMIEPGPSVIHGYSWNQVDKWFEGRSNSHDYDARFDDVHPQSKIDQQLTIGQREAVRRFISEVGGDGQWCATVSGTLQHAAPFDQPVLGILGMWTLGSGANPHFALALATIMERVSQETLAWECYERAADMADRFSRDPDTRAWFLGHVRARQKKIAASRGGDVWEESVRKEFRTQLTWALQQRDDFQKVESERIAAGGPIIDSEADALFWESRPPLATSPGSVDEYHGVMPTIETKKKLNAVVYALLGVSFGTLISVIRRR